MAETKEERPSELYGFSVAYADKKNNQAEARFIKDGRVYGTLSGKLDSRALDEQAQRAFTRYQDEQRQLKEQNA